MNNKVKKTVVEEPFKKRLQYKTFKYCKSLYSLQQTHGTDTAAWNVCVGMKNQTNLVGSEEAKEMSQQATHALADLIKYSELSKIDKDRNRSTLEYNTIYIFSYTMTPHDEEVDSSD
ncbi:hypothetical protein ACTFIY_011555 [Dictyostelium cf. discoideum]